MVCIVPTQSSIISNQSNIDNLCEHLIIKTDEKKENVDFQLIVQLISGTPHSKNTRCILLFKECEPLVSDPWFEPHSGN